MATRLLREMSRRHRIKDRVDRALGVVKAFSVVAPDGRAVQARCRRRRRVSPTRATPSRTSPTSCSEIGEVAKATGAGALFLIDEMHNLDAAVAGGDLHCLSGRQPQRSAGRHGRAPACPTCSVRLMSAKPYADRLFHYLRAGAPHRRGGPRSADQPGRDPRRGVRRRTAARQVVRESAGYPYFLQEYGLELWNHAENVADNESTTSTRFARSSPTRSRATSSPPAFSWPPTPNNATSPRPRHSAIRPTADGRRRPCIRRPRPTRRLRAPRSLIEKGLIWSSPPRDSWTSPSPCSPEYLRENHPLASFA